MEQMPFEYEENWEKNSNDEIKTMKQYLYLHLVDFLRRDPTAPELFTS